MLGISPEQTPDAQAVLNGHYNHIFMSREGQSIVGGGPIHHSTSMDPHHHLDKERIATRASLHKLQPQPQEIWGRVALGVSVAPLRMGNGATQL